MVDFTVNIEGRIFVDYHLKASISVQALTMRVGGSYLAAKR